ncbi:MAG TPA: cyclic nucleotide-binding domain-containing protein [Chloroflexota bacterium]|nr:cyclic nucleotide-binding domain-containing protein [Chloroflexota bacterium]
MSAPACICRHSYTAHVVGSTHGCSFCNCKEYRDPASYTQPAEPKKLTPQAAHALEILGANMAFQHVTRDRLVEIAEEGRRRLFLHGQLLMRQGADSDSLHIVVKGSVEVERNIGGGQTVILAELHPGDIVGEMGVLNGDPRTASVKALNDVETLEVSAKHLKQVFQEDPEVLLAIMKVINERLKTTEDVVENTVRVALAQLGK